MQYMALSDDLDSEVVERDDLVKFDYKAGVNSEAFQNDIPFGTMVLAADPDVDEDDDFERFFSAQVLERHPDGRYKVYFLVDGSFHYHQPNKIALQPFGTFESPPKLFSSCDEFYEMVMEAFQTISVQKEIGDGCLAVAYWSHEADPQATTLLVTYDGQIHMDFNVYSSVETFERMNRKSLIHVLSERNIDGMDQMQTDFFPRGFGKVINFRHDLVKNYFGTKYPSSLMEV